MPPSESVVRGYYFIKPDTGSPKSYYIPFFGSDPDPFDDTMELHRFVRNGLARLGISHFIIGEAGANIGGGPFFAGAVFFRGSRDNALAVYDIMRGYTKFIHVEKPHMEQPPRVAWVYCPWRAHINPIFRRWIEIFDEGRLPRMSANLRRRNYLGLQDGLSEIRYPDLPTALVEHPYVPARITVTLDDPLPDGPRTLEENIFWENRITRHAELVLEAANVDMSWIALYRRAAPQVRNDGTLRSPEVYLYCHTEGAARELAEGFAMMTHRNSNLHITATWTETPISLDAYRNEIWYQAEFWRCV